MMPVAGSRATSSAITTAVPRRKLYGEVTIRATRTGIRSRTRPRWDWMISFTGSGRSAGAFQRPRALRGTWRRSALPIAYRSSREVGRRRREP